ncbi:acylphosphatase [Cytobacillus sp. Hz8]|uniref:acylphosphatase n=1 Tax=Cytobacillus sp. Hz8 TaxID=3347168 RepID=UPI0035DF5D8F
MNDLNQLHIIVSGSVQGVGYRYFAQMKAVQYEITGWAKNRDDGGVEIIASGTDHHLNQFVNELREGNPFSEVVDIQIKRIEEKNIYHSFTIKY